MSSGPPAHHLLLGPGGRARAGLVATVISLLSLGGACLAPPGGRLPPEFPNYPPEFEPESVRPRSLQLTVGALPLGGAPCNPVFEARVRDLDGDPMRFRCILNNRGAGAKVVPFSDGERSGASGFVTVSCRVLNTDFDFSRPSEAEIVTLAVTDAPAFSVSSTVTAPPGLDYAAIDDEPDQGGLTGRAVTTTSWAVTKNPAGQECP